MTVGDQNDILSVILISFSCLCSILFLDIFLYVEQERMYSISPQRVKKAKKLHKEKRDKDDDEQRLMTHRKNEIMREQEENSVLRKLCCL